ncbi:hypothetical protein [Microcoleus sp. F4-D5]
MVQDVSLPNVFTALSNFIVGNAIIPVYLTKNFKGSTRHAIDPWNQSKI